MSARGWMHLVTHFVVGFITGYILMTVLLWVAAKVGHALLWIFLLGPLLCGLFIGSQRLRSARRVGA